MSAYEQLLDLKTRSALDLLVVIAPPRTGSTMLQSVLSKSPSVHTGINDPQGQEEGYQQILDEAHKLLTQQPVARILIKEMSHWIHANGEYKNVFALTDNTVLSIRNPLLSTESRLKKFIESLTIKPMPGVYEWLLHNLTVQTETGDINMGNQKKLLDLYAVNLGFENWESMIQTSYRDQKYSGFEGILTSDFSPTGFSLEQLGWAAIDEEVKYLQRLGKPPVLVDSTDLRLNPEAITRELCRSLNLEFSYYMIRGWKEEDFTHLITEKTSEDKAVQSLWYDSISQSKGIKPPTEPSPELSAFPNFIRDYLISVALPVYVDLYRSEFRVRVEGSVHPEGRTLSEAQLRNIDPVFYGLENGLQIPTQVLLDSLVSQTEKDKGNSKEKIR